jgi:hypothetical protein
MLRAQLNRCCYCRQFYPTAGHNYKKYCFNLALLPREALQEIAVYYGHGPRQSHKLANASVAVGEK